MVCIGTASGLDRLEEAPYSDIATLLAMTRSCIEDVIDQGGRVQLAMAKVSAWPAQAGCGLGTAASQISIRVLKPPLATPCRESLIEHDAASEPRDQEPATMLFDAIRGSHDLQRDLCRKLTASRFYMVSQARMPSHP
jgi:hypothetical protein